MSKRVSPNSHTSSGAGGAITKIKAEKKPKIETGLAQGTTVSAHVVKRQARVTSAARIEELRKTLEGTIYQKRFGEVGVVSFDGNAQIVCVVNPLKLNNDSGARADWIKHATKVSDDRDIEISTPLIILTHSHAHFFVR